MCVFKGLCYGFIVIMNLNACLSLSVTLDVSGEAVPIDIPDVYVVPEKEDVTFTCNSSKQDVFPFWRVDLKVLGSTTGFVNSTQVSSLPSVSSQGGGNPTSFTVRKISAKSSGSVVECMAGFSTAKGLRFSIILNTEILVEGESLYVPINHMQQKLYCSVYTCSIHHWYNYIFKEDGAEHRDHYTVMPSYIERYGKTTWRKNRRNKEEGRFMQRGGSVGLCNKEEGWSMQNPGH